MEHRMLPRQEDKKFVPYGNSLGISTLDKIEALPSTTAIPF